MALLLSMTAAGAQTIAISTAKLNTFRSLLVNAIKTGATARPGVTVTIDNAQGDNQAQLEHLRKYAAQKVDAIIVIPADGDQGPLMTEIAQKAGIPLVFVNTTPANLADLPDNQVLVGSNEHQAGTLQTAEICRLLQGKGKAVVLMGEPFHNAARARTEDVDTVLARPECKGIQVVERQAAYWSLDDADQQVREWLKAGVAFDAVIANNDEMALGAIRALKQAGRPTKDVVIGGIDATGEALAAMAAGDLDVTVLQNAAAQGKAAVDIALKLAAGQKVARETYVPFELVTPQNLAQYLPKSQ